MTECLMSWYGITDLRASLGLEPSTGPVLAALLNGDYTDVVILGFTSTSNTEADANTQLLEFQENLRCLKNSNFEVQRQFINKYANTVAANDNYIEWLKRKIKENGKNPRIHFFPIELKHLNDTQGIYEVATKSLDAISKFYPQERITLYLSPGTPVMAFVWAFAFLRYPHLNIRLIASSQIDIPPEEVELPHEWLEWHGRQISSPNSESEHFDLIFHLFGQQRLPNLQAVMQFSCNEHIFVTSEQFSSDVMKPFIGDAKYREVVVDPYNPGEVCSSILDKYSRNMRIGFNLTGGTKLMFAGAYNACRKMNATPFYINGESNELILLDDLTTMELKKVNSVETFIKLNVDGVDVSENGYWQKDQINRIKLTKLLMKNKSHIVKLYKKIIPNPKNPEPFIERQGKVQIELTNNNIAKLSVGDETIEFDNWENCAKYATGGWFEEYIYLQLRPLVESNLIMDMRIGLKVSAPYEAGDYQEFDVIFTDGIRLFIIECKSGKVLGDDFSKLDSNTQKYGGSKSKSILVSCFKPRSETVQMKFDASNNVELISGPDYERQIKDIIISTQN